MVLKRVNVLVISLIFLISIFSGCSGNEKITADANNDSGIEETVQNKEETEVDDSKAESVEESSETESTETPEAQVDDSIMPEYNIEEYDYSQNLIANYSVENVYAYVSPYNWYHNSWGDNTAVFTYLKEGYTGTRSIKVEVTDYVDGDAKWFFHRIDLEPGDYIYSDYYKSNVDTKAIAVFTDQRNYKSYMNLHNAHASEEWTRYETMFTVPEYAKTATVYRLLMQDGYLITDDAYIAPVQYEGFKKSMLTITFDDDWLINSQTALPIMQKYGYKSNQFYATELVRNAEGTVAKDAIELFIDAGHEIGSHTITHADLSKLTAEEAETELLESKLFLENLLEVDIDYFASPYGVYDEEVNKIIMKYYDAHRTVDYGYNSKNNFHSYDLVCMPVVATTTLDEVEEWVQKAKDENLWLILLFHKIDEEAGDYGTSPEFFELCMQKIQEIDVQVVTISEAMEYIENEE